MKTITAFVQKHHWIITLIFMGIVYVGWIFSHMALDELGGTAPFTYRWELYGISGYAFRFFNSAFAPYLFALCAGRLLHPLIVQMDERMMNKGNWLSIVRRLSIIILIGFFIYQLMIAYMENVPFLWNDTWMFVFYPFCGFICLIWLFDTKNIEKTK